MQVYTLFKKMFDKLFGYYNSQESSTNTIVLVDKSTSLKRSLSSNDIPEFGKKYKVVRFKE